MEGCSNSGCIFFHSPFSRNSLFSCLQTTGPKMDPDAVSGHLPALLHQDGHANLCRAHGRDISLEQNRFWAGSGRILLGLLFHTDPGRTCQRQVDDYTGKTVMTNSHVALGFNSILFVVHQNRRRACPVHLRGLVGSDHSWHSSAGPSRLSHPRSHDFFQIPNGSTAG